MLSREREVAYDFLHFAAARLEECDVRLRDELRLAADCPIAAGGDVVRPLEAQAMLCTELLRPGARA